MAMTTNIYIHKSNQEHGPYRVEDLKAFLQNGQLSATLMSRFEGSNGWVPVFCIPEIREDPALASVINAATSRDAKIEFIIVQRTAEEVGQLIEKLATAVSTENAELQNVINRRTQILWRQVYTYKAQFPDTAEARILEAWYYRLQALTKFNSAGFLKRQHQQATGIVWGFVTGILAIRQERTSASEALPLLDRAIEIYDSLGDRLSKAVIYHLLGQREDSLRELGQIMLRWSGSADLEDYIRARQLRDEIEAS